MPTLMRSLVTALASALFLAYLVIELSTRIWPGDTVALTVLVILALAICGLTNARIALRMQAPGPRRNDRRRDRGASNKKSNAKQARRDDSSKATRDKRKPADAAPKAAQAAAFGATSSAGMETGTVKWFNRSKGYGFVVRENGEEIFLHQRNLAASDGGQRPYIKDGQKVKFVVVDHDKGAQADQVIVLD